MPIRYSNYISRRLIGWPPRRFRATVTSYAAAQKLVAKEHRNARDPRFETEDGETLVDTGEFFVTESEAAKSNPVVYA